ncbi:MAG: ABC transporter family substrate-binding protein [Propionibacteriaceae bacterium]
MLIALLLVGAAGCTGGGSDAPSPTPTVGVPQRDINAHDRADLQHGGTLRQPVATIAGTWNPLSTDGDSADLDTIREPLLPHFFSYDAAGVPTPDPDYLVSATQTAASPTTVAYVLNPAAVWGDGSPVDGDDMIATWRACNGTDRGFRCARTAEFSQIASVTTAADKFHVTVTFKGVYPDWTEVFDSPGVLKAESVADATTFNTGWRSIHNDWLAGPFRFDQYDAGAKILTEVPNQRWWGDPPLLDQLLFRAIAPADQAAAYTDHQLDAYRIDPTTYAQVAKLPGTTIRQAPGEVVRELLVNTGSGVLADGIVRQAVARSIDRGALGATDLQGTGWTISPLGNHVFLPGQPGYADNAAAGGITFDPDRAQADLDAAGWVRGADGVRAKGAAVLQLTILQSDDDPAAAREARLLATQLDAVGVKAEVVSVAADKVAARLQTHAFQIAAVSRTVSRSPYDSLAVYVSGAAANRTQLKLPELDTLVAQVATQSDPAQRAAAANRADVLLWSAAASLPLYQRPDFVATVPTVANFGAFGLSTISYEDVGYLR